MRYGKQTSCKKMLHFVPSPWLVIQEKTIKCNWWRIVSDKISTLLVDIQKSVKNFWAGWQAMSFRFNNSLSIVHLIVYYNLKNNNIKLHDKIKYKHFQITILFFNEKYFFSKRRNISLKSGMYFCHLLNYAGLLKQIILTYFGRITTFLQKNQLKQRWR